MNGLSNKNSSNTTNLAVKRHVTLIENSFNTNFILIILVIISDISHTNLNKCGIPHSGNLQRE